MAKKELEVKVRLTANTADAVRNLGKAEGAFKRFGNFLRTRFVITLGDVQRAMSAVFAAIQKTISLERQEVALRGQLAAMGISFESFIGTLKRVSNNTVATAALITSSSRALLLGIPAEEIGSLLEIAASRAAATGKSVKQAFADITVGIGRSSPKILDNLGFVVSLETAYDSMATKLGKASTELTKNERTLALLNQVTEQGRRTMGQYADSLDDTGTALDQTTASMTNFKDEANKVVAAVGTALAAALTRATAGFVGAGFVLTLIAKQFVDLATLIPFIGDRFEETSQSLLRTSVALQRKMNALNETANALSASADAQAAKFLGLTESMDKNAIALANLKAKQDAQRQSSDDAAVRTANLKLQTDLLTGAQDALAASASKVTAALGETTSVELSNQIFDIIVGLKAQAAILGENSDEFVRLKRIGEDTIRTLQARIESLQDGFGDFGDSTVSAADKLRDFGLVVDETTEKERLLGEEANRTGSALNNIPTGGGGGGFTSFGVSGSTGGIRARSAHNQAAVNQALAQGRRPTLGGTRLQVRGRAVLLA